MTIALWIAQALLALFFLALGGMKAFASNETLQGMHLHPAGGRVLGVLEILGAIALILPGLVGIAQILTPIAAVCLALVLAGALVFHRRYPSETGNAPLVVVLALAVAVAVLRLGPYPL